MFFQCCDQFGAFIPWKKYIGMVCRSPRFGFSIPVGFDMVLLMKWALLSVFWLSGVALVIGQEGEKPS